MGLRRTDQLLFFFRLFLGEKQFTRSSSLYFRVLHGATIAVHVAFDHHRAFQRRKQADSSWRERCRLPACGVNSLFLALTRHISASFCPLTLVKCLRRKTQKCRALACLAIIISDIFCAEFDGLIFQFPLLYPIYHYSRYALDIVVFWMSFWGFDFDFCQSYHNTRQIVISGHSITDTHCTCFTFVFEFVTDRTCPSLAFAFDCQHWTTVQTI